MHILITGGAGFIGSHLIPALLAHNHHVTVLDRKQGSQPTIQYHLGSYAEFDLNSILQHIDSVYHLAWSSTPASSSTTSFERAHNINPSIKLIDAARQGGVGQFVFLSSAGAIYGGNPTPFTESQIPKPHNPYGQAKVKVEQYLQKVSSPNFRVTVFRPTNAIGLNQRLRLGQGLIPAIVTAAQSSQPFHLYGNAAKDYLPVEDLVRALLPPSKPTSQFDIYNLGSGTQLTTSQILDLVNSVTPDPIEVVEHQLANYDIPNLSVSIQKAKTELDWHPQTIVPNYITQIFTHHLT